MAILIESISLLKFVLYSLSCWSPKQKWCDKACYSYLVMCTTTRSSWFYIWFQSATANWVEWSKANADVRLALVWLPGLEIPIIIQSWQNFDSFFVSLKGCFHSYCSKHLGYICHPLSVNIFHDVLKSKLTNIWNMITKLHNICNIKKTVT